MDARFEKLRGRSDGVNETHPEIVIIKRHASHEDEHHGGAWKIAFADFMTAMMAFFLVLWIINATDKDTKSIIARYFNPIKLEDQSRTRKGIRGAESSETPQVAIEAVDDNRDGAVLAGEPVEKPASAEASSDQANDEAGRRGMSAEARLFYDPYKSLDEIAARGATEAGAAIGDDATRQTEVRSGDQPMLEPFQPVPRGARSTSPEAAAVPQPRGMDGLSPPRVVPSESEATGNGKNVAVDRNVVAPAINSDKSAPRPDSGASNSQTLAQARGVEAEVRNAMSGPRVDGMPTVDVRAVRDGLLISLMDDTKSSMFAQGSAEPTPATVRLLGELAVAIGKSRGAVVVRGHTDARPFRSRTYDNSRLSAARAQMAYYMLVRGGVPESRIEHIEGYGASKPLSGMDPKAPENRRIEILLRSEGSAVP